MSYIEYWKKKKKESLRGMSDKPLEGAAHKIRN